MIAESNRIEFKLELTNDLEKEAVAFFNNKEGGLVNIGVDKSGCSVGVSNIDSGMLKIIDRLKHNITPSCMGLFDQRVENIEETDIIKITFASGPEKPYYITKKGMCEKGVFMRVGTAAESMPQKMFESLFSKRTRNSIGKLNCPIRI